MELLRRYLMFGDLLSINLSFLSKRCYGQMMHNVYFVSTHSKVGAREGLSKVVYGSTLSTSKLRVYLALVGALAIINLI